MSKKMKAMKYERLKRKVKFKGRVFNQCSQCGRRQAYIRFFGVCRICLRKMAHEGLLPGVVKSSW